MFLSLMDSELSKQMDHNMDYWRLPLAVCQVFTGSATIL